MSIPVFQFTPPPLAPWYPYACSPLLYFCLQIAPSVPFFWIPHVRINVAFWTLSLCKNLSQLLSPGLRTSCSHGLLLLHSVQLICWPLGAFTRLSPFQGGLLLQAGPLLPCLCCQSGGLPGSMAPCFTKGQGDELPGCWTQRYPWRLVICATVLSCTSCLESCPRSVLCKEKPVYLSVVFDSPCLLSWALLCSSRCTGSCWGSADHPSHHMAPCVPPHLIFSCSFSCHLGHANVGPLAQKYSEFQGDTSTVLDQAQVLLISGPCVFEAGAAVIEETRDCTCVYSLLFILVILKYKLNWGIFSVLLLCYICSRWNLFFDR